MARAKVVLPAPRSPDSVSRSPGSSAAAMSTISRRVASSSASATVKPQPPEVVGNIESSAQGRDLIDGGAAGGPDAFGQCVLFKRALTSSEILTMNVERAPSRRRFTRCGGPAEHDLAGGAELPFVLGQALSHPVLVRDRVLAKPKRIRRAGVGVRLRIRKCGNRSHDYDDAGYGGQFTHDIAHCAPICHLHLNDKSTTLFLRAREAAAGSLPQSSYGS